MAPASFDFPSEIHELLDRSSNFTVALLTREQSREDEHGQRAAHESVLRPLLAAADECWAYGLENGSPALAAAPVLAKERSRYRVDLSGEPILGHEFFWNAHGGKRGSIAITVPIGRMDTGALFSQCLSAFVFTNYRAGHNGAAISYAQRKINDESHLVFLLSRNNGLQWMNVFAPNPLVYTLFAQAWQGGRDRT